MAARQAFLKTLAADGGSQKATPQNEGDSKAMVSCPAVAFTLTGILEFKGRSQTSSSYKLPAETPRLRPNYDSSRRKLYATPPVRKRWLSLPVIFCSCALHLTHCFASAILIPYANLATHASPSGLLTMVFARTASQRFWLRHVDVKGQPVSTDSAMTTETSTSFWIPFGP